jgi:copper resistance protein B
MAMPMEPSDAAPFGSPVDDTHIFYHVLFDQLEGRFGSQSSFRWQGEAWGGTDRNRVFLKSQGEVTNGVMEDGNQELLYARPISSFFNLQGGVRYDLDSGPGRGWAAFGIEGLAPQFFYVTATGYVGSEGRLAAKLEGSYDILLTQRLILQPQMELNFFSKDDPARQIGAGLSSLDAGLRLRYEFIRKFAPYIAMTFENKFGDTANLARASGDPVSALRVSAGIRIWY